MKLLKLLVSFIVEKSLMFWQHLCFKNIVCYGYKFTCLQISDKVQKWEKISWEKFKKMCQNKNLHAYETEADFGKSSPEIHDYYHAAINHHTLVLNLYTCVYSGYPRPCPYIKLSMIDSNQKSLDSSQCNFVRVSLVVLLTLAI